MISPIVIISILAIAFIGYLLYHRSENYGGSVQVCEDQCFGSQYYDYCMDVCLNNGSTADFTGRAEEYSIPAIGAPIPLEDEDGDEYVSTFAGPYRYDYPGH